MKLRPLLPLLLLAACTTDPEPRESDRRASEAAHGREAAAAAPRPADSREPAERDAPLIAPALPNTGPRADPGEMQSFREWVVGCDNRWFCTAVGLGPEAGEFLPLRIVVMRPGGGASPRVIVESNEAIAPPVTIEIDGKTAASGGTAEAEAVAFTGQAARRLIAALIEGEEGRVVAGEQSAALSLGGASAVLRYMDETQRIAGTTAALVAKGEARPTATPPAAPVVRRIAPGGKAAELSQAQVAAMRRAADCQIAFLPEEQTGAETHALGGGTTLVLLPCGAGAYNFISAVFVVDGAGVLRPARFDAPTGIDPESDAVPQLVNVGFERGVLSSFARGRGIGDCGIEQRFVWDGARFRLIAQNEMNECRGSTRLVRTWQATPRE